MPELTTLVSLFSGIGGFEKGFEDAGWTTVAQCEVNPRSRRVLAEHFDAPCHSDITTLERMPEAHLVTAGFPCTDISQAGTKKGLDGDASSLVFRVFELLEESRTPWVVLENVKNLLLLNRGAAVKAITDRFEALGYRWAYRLVDARSFGLAQRRQRVIFVASLHEDPVPVLFSDNTTADPTPESPSAYGFMWEGGLRGTGWVEDAVSPITSMRPSLWIPERNPPLVQLNLEAIEALQGFDRGWAKATTSGKARMRQIGNALPPQIAEWVARRILEPGEVCIEEDPEERVWYPAAHGGPELPTVRMASSEFPLTSGHPPVLSQLQEGDFRPLPPRAARGFMKRYEAGRLTINQHFVADMRTLASE